MVSRLNGPQNHSGRGGEEKVPAYSSDRTETNSSTRSHYTKLIQEPNRTGYWVVQTCLSRLWIVVFQIMSKFISLDFQNERINLEEFV
jgi:hypothetical protein